MKKKSPRNRGGEMYYWRKKPPSQIRYERSHPTVSARLDMVTYEKLQEMVKGEGKSLAGFLKDYVNRRKEKYDEAYQKGYRDGAKENEIWFYCYVCGEKITIPPGSDAHKMMIEYMKAHKWCHSTCTKEK